MLVDVGVAHSLYIQLSFWGTLQSAGRVPQKNTYDHRNAEPNCEDCHGVPFRTEQVAAAETQRKCLSGSLPVGRTNRHVGNDEPGAGDALHAVDGAPTKPSRWRHVRIADRALIVERFTYVTGLKGGPRPSRLSQFCDLRI